LGREQKRKIRAWVHHFVTNRLGTDQTLELRGMLNYVNSVEPAFMRRLRKKYGADTIRHLQTGQ
jgi:RNA-directed DNA polymerase